jgi:hypothetical protein
MEPRDQHFYVLQDCCITCGVPQAVAPTLVGWRETEGMTQCYWIRQPETPDEVEQAIQIFDQQEVGCHRYAGTDSKIIRRLPPGQCDFPKLGLLDSFLRLVGRWYRDFR